MNRVLTKIVLPGCLLLLLNGWSLNAAAQVGGIPAADTTAMISSDTLPSLQATDTIRTDTMQTNALQTNAPEENEVPKDAHRKIFGTRTEIKKLNDYKPDEVVQKLKKGNFGHPVAAKDSVKWKKGGLFTLNVNQGSLQNWAAGGDNFSIALGALANLYANFSDGRNSWDNNVDMAFGYLKTTSLGMRKSDDKIDLYSKYGYKFSKNWFYSAMLSFRSQFSNGYLYPDDSTVVSHFLAPAYVMGSLGFNYKPKDYFSVFFSPLTSRFVIVNDQRMADMAAYGVDSATYQYLPGGAKLLKTHGKKTNYELGSYISAQFNKSIMKNITWTTRLDLYSNYLHNPRNIDIYWTSLLALKVNRFITASINTELIYDDDVKFITYATNEDGSVQKNPETGENVVLKRSARIQFKELIGVGFAYKF